MPFRRMPTSFLLHARIKLSFGTSRKARPSARAYDKNVTAARFLPPDGKTILVGTEDGTIEAFADGLKTPLTSVKAGGKVERFSREGQLHADDEIVHTTMICLKAVPTPDELF